MALVPDTDDTAGERPVLAGGGAPLPVDVGEADGEDEGVLAFAWELSDGRVARCTELIEQEYANGCRFSAGLVEEMPPEEVYLRVDHGDEATCIFMRRDEANAACWVLNGALMLLMIGEVDE